MPLQNNIPDIKNNKPIRKGMYHSAGLIKVQKKINKIPIIKGTAAFS